MKKITDKLRKLSRRPEARHVGTLMSGSMAAQAALVARAPLLARLFPPGAFGLFSLMLTISTIGGAVGGLCYEVAVILPRSPRMAKALYRLAFLLRLVALSSTCSRICLGARLPRASMYIACWRRR